MSDFDFDKALNKVAEYEEYVQELPENQLSIEPWDFQVTMPEFQLGKLIPARSIGMLFGASNSGKSHLICDIVRAHLQGDQDWQGHTLSAGDIVMFSESLGHMQARMKAYLTHAGKAIKNRIYLHPTKGYESSEIESLGEWIDRLQRPPKMMIFDTLATAFQFEENDNREASRLIKLIEDHLVPRLDPCGCVVIVHHTSKASEGRSARGASALIGNIDWSVQVSWDKEIEKTVASWEKDRWRLVEDSPQWAGNAFRVPVSFTNGEADMMILEWEEYSQEHAEAVRQLKEDMKMDAVKANVAEAIRNATKPVYIQSNSQAKTPTGIVAFRIKDLVKDTRMVGAMVDYVKDNFDWEPVFTKRGTEWGIKVVGGESPK